MALPHCPGPRPCSPHSLRSRADTAPDAGSSLPTPPLRHLQRNLSHPSSCLIPGSLSHRPGNQPQTGQWGSLPHWRSSGTTWQRRRPTIPLWNHSAQKAVKKGWARAGAAGSREGAGLGGSEPRAVLHGAHRARPKGSSVQERPSGGRGSRIQNHLDKEICCAESPLAPAREGTVALLGGISLTLTAMHAPSAG